MKLLLVEDNQALAGDIEHYLKGQGFVVETTSSFSEASENLALYQYDLAIIDLGLPDGSGLELVREMRAQRNEAGILILTAKDAVEQKVNALNSGADDYMTKPFHKAELNARIHSILRRNKFNRNNWLHAGDIKIDLLASQAYVNDAALNLTKKEFDLLLYFMQNTDRMLTKENIAEHLWGDHIDQVDRFDFIYNHIKNLRKKIARAGGGHYIHAMYGMGYKFSVHPKQPD